MSLSASVGVQIPTNVVEVGNEISQNSINALAAASSPSTVNPLMTSSAVAASYATKASPTFTGTVTIPAGASIAGYATQSYVTGLGYLTDAPSNGSEYVRKNGSWAVATGGGGGGSVAWGSITGTVTDQTDLTSYISGLGYQTSGNVSTYVTSLGYQTASDVSTYVTSLGFITSVPSKTLNTIGAAGSYQLAAGDQDKVHFLNGGMSGSTLVIPADSTYAFPNGTEITVACDNMSSSNMIITGQYSGQPTINSISSVTLNTSQYVSKLVKVATDTWLFA